MILAGHDDYELSVKNMTQDQFAREYLEAKEKQWSVLIIPMLEAIDREVRRRQLRDHLLNQIGEVTLPHERWLNQRYEEAQNGTSRSEQTESEATPMEPYMRHLRNDPRSRHFTSTDTPTPSKEPKSGASTGSGEFSTGPVSAAGAVRLSKIAPPSTEASSGAPNVAASTFGIEAYLRLPLQAKRDAFVTDGMLFVRKSWFREMCEHFVSGRCCEPSRRGEGVHASDCWIHLDAVR